MSPLRDHTRRRLFWLLTAACVAVAVVYVIAVGQRTKKKAAAPVTQPQPSAVTSPSRSSHQRTLTAEADDAGAAEPVAPRENVHPHAAARFAALTMSTPESVGTIMSAPIDRVDDRSETAIQCERAYFSRDKGICLRREIRFYAAQTAATVFDEKLHPLFTVRTEGIPSRARISPDGRYAALTAFVSGHSYADARLSTATLILDTSTGSTLANLEQFTVIEDGKVLHAPDFNFWGVTFRRDSNLFFATLQTAGNTYLVRGDISARTITVLYKGVECPSLSPDETRVAFKKLISPVNWRLTVLDLSTFKETPLAETRSVDDQAEWLDNGHVLYAMPDDAPAMGVSILSVAADGGGQPQVFARGAASPAVIR